MKISHLSYSDSKGGAARAAFRIHKMISTSSNSCLNTKMIVGMKSSSDIYTYQLSNNILMKIFFKVFPKVTQSLSFLDKSYNPFGGYFSPSFFDLRNYKLINKIDSDLFHIHWVQNDFLSIKDISLIKKRIIWTMHDLWPICGAEHYPSINDDRYQIGYSNHDLRYSLKFSNSAWRRKLKYFSSNIIVHVTSSWSEEICKNSIIFKKNKIYKIPLPIDINQYKPNNKKLARLNLGIDSNVFTILIGAAAHSARSNIKGFDIVKKIVNSRRLSKLNIKYLTFGLSSLDMNANNIINLDLINDDKKLVDVYSSADVFLMSSRMETWGQTASEAMSCGLPVIGFNTSGLIDIVDHMINGILVKPYVIKSIEDSIIYLYENRDVLFSMSNLAREKVVKYWSYEKLLPEYISMYQSNI